MAGFLFVGSAVGAPFLGWLTCQIGYTKVVMVAASSLSLLLFAVMIFLPFSLLVLGILCFLAGFFGGSYILSFSVVERHCNRKNQGFDLAIANAAMLVAAPVIQPLIGLIL